MGRRKAGGEESGSLILEAALEVLAKEGPGSIRPQEICSRLGYSKTLVNYHFGGREGLIAEAIVLGYSRYVDDLWQAASSGKDPLDRLMAWLHRQIDWTLENPGLAAALDFPRFVLGGDVTIPPELELRFNAAGHRNFTNLMALVSEARAAVQPRKAGRGGVTDPFLVGLDSAVIGWTVLGLSVWMAGGHAPTHAIGFRGFIPQGRGHLRNMVVALLSSSQMPLQSEPA